MVSCKLLEIGKIDKNWWFHKKIFSGNFMSIFYRIIVLTLSTPHFKGLGMRCLQFEIRICQKNHNKVTLTMLSNFFLNQNLCWFLPKNLSNFILPYLITYYSSFWYTCYIFLPTTSAFPEYLDCDVTVIPAKYDFKPYAYGFQKDSPYLGLFNHYLKELREKG